MAGFWWNICLLDHDLMGKAGFNSIEFDGIRNEAGCSRFFLSARAWIDSSGAR